MSTLADQIASNQNHPCSTDGDKTNSKPAAYFAYVVASSFIIILMVLLVYRHTLFQFFNSDDFFTLTWLKIAAKQPDILPKQFVCPWLGVPHPLYYRPLSSIVLFWEYSLWGANALCMRTMNILYQLVNTMFVGLITFELGDHVRVSRSWQSRHTIVWAIFTAALFAFSPLNAFCLNWISCKPEICVNLMSLASVWSFLRWHRTGAQILRIFSLVLMMLALLCKETAIFVPFLLLSFELLQTVSRKSEICVSARLPDAAKNLCPEWLLNLANATGKCSGVWIVLTLYLVLRKNALGVFVGGFNSKIQFYSSGQAMVHSWLLSLHKIFVPINYAAFDSGSQIELMWQVCILASIGLSMAALAGSAFKKIGAFLVVWFVLSLVPSYRFMLIDQNLLESTRAFAASVPMCIFLGLGIAKFFFDRRFHLPLLLLAGAMTGLSLLTLEIDNRASARAGWLSNKIVQQLRQYYRSAGTSRPVRILGLPLVLDGSYVCFNADLGMLQMPFQQSNVSNCHFMEASETVPNLDYVVTALRDHNDDTDYLYWDSQSERLKPVSIGVLPQERWKVTTLRTVLSVLPGSTKSITWNRDGTTVHITTMKRCAIELLTNNLDCAYTHRIKFKMQLDQIPRKETPQADLQYRNAIATDETWQSAMLWKTCAHASIERDLEPHTLNFAFDKTMPWALGGKCDRLILVVPGGLDFHLFDISVE